MNIILFIHSFIHTFIYSFTNSFIHSFVRSWSGLVPPQCQLLYRKPKCFGKTDRQTLLKSLYNIWSILNADEWPHKLLRSAIYNSIRKKTAKCVLIVFADRGFYSNGKNWSEIKKYTSKCLFILPYRSQLFIFYESN